MGRKAQLQKALSIGMVQNIDTHFCFLFREFTGY